MRKGWSQFIFEWIDELARNFNRQMQIAQRQGSSAFGEEHCSAERSFGFLLFFCLLVFKDYRKEAFEITGWRVGAVKGREISMNTHLVGEACQRA